MSKVTTLDTQSNVLTGSFREGFTTRIIRQIRDWNDRRQAIRQLNMMSDRLLSDIGIERYQIADAVKVKAACATVKFDTTVSSKELTEVRDAA